MSTSRAADNRAAAPRTPPGSTANVAAWLASVVSALLVLFGSVGLAQAAPTVGLDGYEYTVGDVLHVSGSSLTPNSDYRVSVTPAGGEAVVQVVKSDRFGSINVDEPLTTTGDHAVSVEGRGISAMFTITVKPAASRGGAGASPTAPGTAGQPAPPDQGEAPGTATPPEQATPPGEAAPPEEAAPPGVARQPGTPASPEGTTPPAAPGAPGASPQQEAPVAPQDVGYPSVELTEGGLQGVQAGTTLWTLTFEPGSGQTAGLIQTGAQAWVGHGNSLLEIDARTGSITARHRLSAQVSDVRWSAGRAVATLTYSNGAQSSVAVGSAGGGAGGGADALPLEPFDVDLKLYTWLRTEAEVADPVARLSQDPTNPWLYLAAARTVQPGSAAEASYIEGALENAATFYERAQIARELMRFSPSQAQAAASAMYGALDDFVARGYRAPLLYDQVLSEAYGFPLGALQAALGRGDMQAAGFWADWVYLLATPAVPPTQSALKEYSTYLRVDGQREAADRWLERSREGGGFDLASAVRQTALDVGRTGWYGVAALLVALLALYIALAAKYWRPQSLTMRRRSSSGAVPRLFFLRYATFTERLVAVLLLAAAMALTALQGWARDGDSLPTAWGSGSLASVPVLDALARTSGSGSDIAFVRGYAEQMAGADDPAAEAYRSAPDDADALNNLGVLLEDPTLFRRALELKPGLPAANFNLGQGGNPSRLLSTFAPDEAALVVPDETRLRSAVAGSFAAALAGVFTNPWAALTNVNGVELAHWLWVVIVVVFLVIVLFNVVQLVLPRPRLARNAPRTPLYHVLAVLLPGTGQADELWGVLLSVPWAIFGVDALLHVLDFGAPPALSLNTDLIGLGVVYFLNIVTFFVELASYGRRMRALKLNDPETARAYGMRGGG